MQYCWKKRQLQAISFSLYSGQAPSKDDTDITLEQFEEEFEEFTNDENEAKKWAKNLEESEQEIDEQNEEFESGESPYFEELNEFSQLSKKEFQKEKTGLIKAGGERKFATGLLRMSLEESERLSK